MPLHSVADCALFRQAACECLPPCADDIAACIAYHCIVVVLRTIFASDRICFSRSYKQAGARDVARAPRSLSRWLPMQGSLQSRWAIPRTVCHSQQTYMSCWSTTKGCPGLWLAACCASANIKVRPGPLQVERPLHTRSAMQRACPQSGAPAGAASKALIELEQAFCTIGWLAKGLTKGSGHYQACRLPMFCVRVLATRCKRLALQHMPLLPEPLTRRSCRFA